MARPIPQGVLAVGFVGDGQLRRRWFLAAYRPPALRRPVAVGMVLVGLGRYGYGRYGVRRRSPR